MCKQFKNISSQEKKDNIIHVIREDTKSTIDAQHNLGPYMICVWVCMCKCDWSNDFSQLQDENLVKTRMDILQMT